MSDLTEAYLKSQNYQPTTIAAKAAWFGHWERDIIKKPLADAGLDDVLKLKDEFASHRGRVPMKYFQALRSFYRWVTTVRPGFVDPTQGVRFSMGVETATKDAVSREDMGRVLEWALKRSKTMPWYGGSDGVKVGKQMYKLRPYLWYWTLRIAPLFLMRAHEILPYKAPHKVRITNFETYEVACEECSFVGRYWPEEGRLVEVVKPDKRHVPNEKLEHFMFGTATDKEGRRFVTTVFRRKGRVRLNRQTGEINSETHWSDPKPWDKETLHWLRCILLAPPYTTSAATKVLNRVGDELGIKLKNSKGEPTKLSTHIFAKHSVVTNRKLEGDVNDTIARDADVAVPSLRQYDHVAGKPDEISRMISQQRGFWKEKD